MSSGRTARAMVAAGIVVGLLVAGACSGDDGGGADPGDDAGTTTSAAAPAATTPVGPPPGATEQGFRELSTGDCFDPVDDPVAEDRAVWLLDCADPHRHEVYETLDYEGEDVGGGAPYPGVPAVQNWAEQSCHDRFEAFVGQRWTLSELEIQVWWPSEDSWGRGDRTVLCTVFSPDGDAIVGTQRDSGR